MTKTPCEYGCTDPRWCPACDAEFKVDTSTRYSALTSAARVRESYFHASGTWCTEAQSIAACFSVPDGVGVNVAALNVGPEMRELDARDWVAQRENLARLGR